MLQIGHTNLTPSYFLQEQEQPVCTCGEALTVKHIIKDCSDLAELRQEKRVTGDLKEDLGHEQLPIGSTLSFLKRARLLYKPVSYTHLDVYKRQGVSYS